MPLANAALAADVRTRLPKTVASLLPPSVLVYEMACWPGNNREPDTMAAMVSSRCCLVFSATAAGNGLRNAPAIYPLNFCISGEMFEDDFPAMA